MRRSPLTLIPLLAPLASVASGTEPIRIDDTTLLDPVRGTVLTVRPEVPFTSNPAPAPVLRSLNDGFAGCSTSDNCAPFDLTTHVSTPAIDLLPEGNYPYDATMNAAATEVWIPGASGDGVIVINRAMNAIAHRIPVGEYPVSVAFSKDGTKALVACRDTEEVKIVSTTTYAVTDSLLVPTTFLGAGNIALDPVSGNFYMVDWFGDDLYEIAPDGSAILNQVTLGSSLWQLVVAPDGQKIYLTDRGTDQIRVIDQATLTQVDAWAVGDDPWGIDVTDNGAKLVVACEDSHEAYVIDAGTGATTPLLLDPSADPRDVDIRDDQETAYVAGGTTTSGNLVYRIDLTTDTIAGSFAVTGTNVNVVAVQAQRVDATTGVGDFVAAAGSSLRAHPNPFVSSTHVKYSLAEAAEVRLTVYDVSGRVVRRLYEGRGEAREHELSWNGRDTHGRRVAGGTYFVRLQAGDTETQTVKVVFLGN